MADNTVTLHVCGGDAASSKFSLCAFHPSQTLVAALQKASKTVFIFDIGATVGESIVAARICLSTLGSDEALAANVVAVQFVKGDQATLFVLLPELALLVSALPEPRLVARLPARATGLKTVFSSACAIDESIFLGSAGGQCVFWRPSSRAGTADVVATCKTPSATPLQCLALAPGAPPRVIAGSAGGSLVAVSVQRDLADELPPTLDVAFSVKKVHDAPIVALCVEAADPEEGRSLHPTVFSVDASTALAATDAALGVVLWRCEYRTSFLAPILGESGACVVGLVAEGGASRRRLRLAMSRGPHFVAQLRDDPAAPPDAADGVVAWTSAADAFGASGQSPPALFQLLVGSDTCVSARAVADAAAVGRAAAAAKAAHTYALAVDPKQPYCRFAFGTSAGLFVVQTVTAQLREAASSGVAWVSSDFSSGHAGAAALLTCNATGTIVCRAVEDLGDVVELPARDAPRTAQNLTTAFGRAGFASRVPTPGADRGDCAAELLASPCGRFVAVRTRDGRLGVFADLPRTGGGGGPLPGLPAEVASAGVSSCAWLPQGRLVALLGAPLRTGASRVALLLLDERRIVSAVAVSGPLVPALAGAQRWWGGGRWLAAAIDGTIRFYDVDSSARAVLVASVPGATDVATTRVVWDTLSSICAVVRLRGSLSVDFLDVVDASSAVLHCGAVGAAATGQGIAAAGVAHPDLPGVSAIFIRRTLAVLCAQTARLFFLMPDGSVASHDVAFAAPPGLSVFLGCVEQPRSLRTALVVACFAGPTARGDGLPCEIISLPLSATATTMILAHSARFTAYAEAGAAGGALRQALSTLRVCPIGHRTAFELYGAAAESTAAARALFDFAQRCGVVPKATPWIPRAHWLANSAVAACVADGCRDRSLVASVAHALSADSGLFDAFSRACMVRSGSSDDAVLHQLLLAVEEMNFRD